MPSSLTASPLPTGMRGDSYGEHTGVFPVGPPKAISQHPVQLTRADSILNS